jgi:hypothetical protein
MALNSIPDSQPPSRGFLSQQIHAHLLRAGRYRRATKEPAPQARLRWRHIAPKDRVLDASRGAFGAIASGELTTEEGTAVCSVIETKRRAIETQNLESRIAILEHAAEAGGKK